METVASAQVSAFKKRPVNVRKRKPSAIRDFPPGCGRDADDMTQNELHALVGQSRKHSNCGISNDQCKEEKTECKVLHSKGEVMDIKEVKNDSSSETVSGIRKGRNNGLSIKKEKEEEKEKSTFGEGNSKELHVHLASVHDSEGVGAQEFTSEIEKNVEEGVSWKPDDGKKQSLSKHVGATMEVDQAHGKQSPRIGGRMAEIIHAATEPEQLDKGRKQYLEPQQDVFESSASEEKGCNNGVMAYDQQAPKLKLRKRVDTEPAMRKKILVEKTEGVKDVEHKSQCVSRAEGVSDPDRKQTTVKKREEDKQDKSQNASIDEIALAKALASLRSKKPAARKSVKMPCHRRLSGRASGTSGSPVQKEQSSSAATEVTPRPSGSTGQEEQFSCVPGEVTPDKKVVSMIDATTSSKRKTKPSGSSSGQKKSTGKKNTVEVVNEGEDARWKEDAHLREEVKKALMTYDALHRTLAVAADDKKNPHVKAGNIMSNRGRCLHRDDRYVGHVPGIVPGDQFYFRYEPFILGLTAQIQGGIDFVGANSNQWNKPVAICIIASGGYEDDEQEDGATLIYSGQGGMSEGKKCDQKLERGNLALDNSRALDLSVRVIRGLNDPLSPSGKIYTYDGLYKVKETTAEKNNEGHDVYKFTLKRLPNQPRLMLTILKAAAKWKRNSNERQGLIQADISSNLEKVPVALVNSRDDVKYPPNLQYINKLKYRESCLPEHDSLKCCNCKGDCTADASCSCFVENGNLLPYSINDSLVKWRPVIFECSDKCKCRVNCRNKVCQNGIKYHLEIFRTEIGWGVRSWDPIPAGSFICEYIGEVTLGNDLNIEGGGEEKQYVMNAQRSQESSNPPWGDISELLPEVKGKGSNWKPCQLNFWLDASKAGNVARFINHSSSPNVFIQAVLYDHHDLRFPHMMLFAKEHIAPMTELTMDYGLN
eukprot:TRINITY_DN28412_c0_g1_i1.p1 TRINITY_DN28412_c0_g1~~TRINITY_DN28412_c0_g1_i1.p1  ORF type:complete len:934 (+),score=208.85 TRINITY_DN28412_c0_g1_i1:219-3020(+)